MVGGSNVVRSQENNSYLAETEVIPISENQNKQAASISPMLDKRLSFGMCSYLDCFFVTGGYYNRYEILDKCELYSFESRKWYEIGSMNTKKCEFSLVYFQNEVRAVGGYNHSNRTVVDTIEI